jgi:hypothetical protein
MNKSFQFHLLQLDIRFKVTANALPAAALRVLLVITFRYDFHLQVWKLPASGNRPHCSPAGSCVPCMSIMQHTLVVSCRKSLNIQINIFGQATRVQFSSV